MEQTDKDLLERFLLNQDETAFETIVKRYGSMVMGVCHRTIGNTHDAEDAFQATFCVLARKVAKLRLDQPIGGWLYQVAVQEAMNMKAKAFKRYEETGEMDEVVTEQSNNEIWAQVRPVLDEELSHLSDKLRQPLVLCYLEGRTYEDAANHLGLAHSKLKSRLSQARDLLRDRLVRRGIVLSSTVLATLILENVSAAPSSALIGATVKAASSTAITGIISVSMIQTLKGLIQTMLYKKVSLAVLGIAVASILTGLFITSKLPGIPEQPRFKEKQEEQEIEAIQSTPLVSTHEDEIQIQKIEIAEEVQLPTSVEDYVKRFQEAMKLPDAKDRWQAWRRLGITLSDQDFEEAEKKAGWWEPHSEILSKWVETNPAAAASWVYRLQSFPKSRLLSFNMLSKYQDKIHFALHQGDLFQDELLKSVLAQWTLKDPQSALAWARQLPEGLGRNVSLLGIAGALALSSPQEALSLLPEISKETQDSAIVEIARKWVWKDPQAVASWALQLPEGNTSRLIISESIRHWATENIDSVRTWIEQLPSGKRTPSAIGALVTGWAFKDLVAAREWVEKLPSDEEQRWANSRILLAWPQEDIQSAIEWIEHLPPGENKNSALKTLGSLWSGKNVQAGITWAEKLPESKTKVEIFHSLVENQIAQSAVEASSFSEAIRITETLPEEYQEGASFSVARKWLMADSQSVARWLEALPTGKKKESLFSNLLAKYGEFFEPTTAIQLAGEITDPIRKNSVLESIGKAWLLRDKPTATQWLLQSSLPPETKDKLLRQQ